MPEELTPQNDSSPSPPRRSRGGLSHNWHHDLRTKQAEEVAKIVKQPQRKDAETPEPENQA